MGEEDVSVGWGDGVGRGDDVGECVAEGVEGVDQVDGGFGDRGLGDYGVAGGLWEGWRLGASSCGVDAVGPYLEVCHDDKLASCQLVA